MSAMMNIRLVVNNDIKAYQVQIGGEANFPHEFLEKHIEQDAKSGRTQSILYMGSVVDIGYFKDLAREIYNLERIGFRPVGKGSNIHPDMVLNEAKFEWSKHR